MHRFCTGRTKLEPVAIVILAVVMSLASVQMVREAVTKIVVYSTKDASGPVFKLPAILICCITIGKY